MSTCWLDGVRVIGKTGERLVPVTPNIMAMVRAQGGHSHAVWVGDKGTLTISGIQRIVREAMIRAGIRPPKLGPHALRHTFAVQYITGGGISCRCRRYSDTPI